MRFGPRVAPANLFLLNDDEAYAGVSTSEWEVIAHLHLGFLKPVKLDDMEPKNQKCDICWESFGSSNECTNREQPVSLPCGHIFGKDCISDWIGIKRDDVEVSFEEEIDYSDNFPDLLPRSVASPRTHFVCPKCRKTGTILILGEQAPEVEARLQFWDRAYQVLGVVRSVKEEECRQDLLRFVERMKTEQKELSWDQTEKFDVRARLSAIQFALRRARRDLNPLQRYLRDAFFTLGCTGVDDYMVLNAHEFCIESYEDESIPSWCWQFDRWERGLNARFSLNDGIKRFERFFEKWSQQRLGPWRRELFAEIYSRGGLS